MIRDRAIVVIGTADWDAPLWTNQQHLVSRLAAAGNRVLFVESLGLREPRLAGRDLARIRRRLLRGLSGVRRVRENLEVLSPLVLPFHRFRAARALNRAILLHSVRSATRGARMEGPILWAFSPAASVLAGRLGESLLVYHCVDEYAAVPGIPAEVAAMERELLSRAGLVITTSQPLFESKRPFNANTVYEPNVADVALFAKARDANAVRAPEVDGLARPVLGFVGALDDYKVDDGILRAVAAAFPEGTLVLIGPKGLADSGAACAALLGLPNVRWLGAQPHERLPEFMAGFDVCLVPYRMSAYTRGVFPMKLIEALATGRPVVATRLPAIAGLEPIVRLAEGPDAFVAAVRTALVEDTAALATERTAFADRNSWEARLESISARIERLVPSRAKTGGFQDPNGTTEAGEPAPRSRSDIR